MARISIISLICALPLAAHLTGATPLPPPTGQHSVGVAPLELTDTSRFDLFSPSTHRKLQLSLYYPTARPSRPPTNPAPYAPPAVLPYLTEYYAFPPAALSRITTHSLRHPPALPLPSLPTLIFTPGFESSRYFGSALCEDLASHGFLVLALDHPFDALAVQWRNGSITPETPLGRSVVDFDDVRPFYAQRVDDLVFLARHIEAAVAKAQVAVRPMREVGVFGHSLGGAAAHGAMLREGRLAAGVNMDGAFFDNMGGVPDATADLERPFLLMASANRSSVSRDADPTFAPWREAQSAWFAEVEMRDAAHSSYGDVGMLVDLLGVREEMPEKWADVINGVRAMEIQRAWLRDFFDWQLKGGEGRVVKGGDAGEWPEMVLVDGPAEKARL